ncbi:IS66 family insertion sequence element accessory protein TnpA [Burkholderia stagnalis]|uniref:IS66 family insertion sequence element accessory protein TnpA n=1 Tax=Burkholderia stagnalis TaxID=1503054 RepID=UPI0039BF725E
MRRFRHRSDWSDAMDDDAIERAAVRTRRPRQGEAFWREMIEASPASGVGARRSCREQGLAVSTFGVWRKTSACDRHGPRRRSIVCGGTDVQSSA